MAMKVAMKEGRERGSRACEESAVVFVDGKKPGITHTHTHIFSLPPPFE